MDSSSLGSSTRRPRRDARRDRNRELLLEAAMELLLREGTAAVTPTRVTDQAGLHKPAFYAHFKDVSDCLAQVARRITGSNMASELAMHQAALRAQPYELASEQRALEATLRNALEYRSAYQLLSRHRNDEGPLGVALRDNISTAVADTTELLWELGLRHGLRAHHLKEVAALAEVLTDHTLVAIGRVIENRVSDVAAEAARLARYNHAIVTAELERMLREPTGPSDA